MRQGLFMWRLKEQMNSATGLAVTGVLTDNGFKQT